MSRPRIFISYAVEDRQWANELALALSRRSIDTWIDTVDLKPGENPTQALVSGLRNSDVYAMVIGKKGTSANINFLFELGIAAATGRPAVPIIISADSATDPTKSFPNIHKIQTDNVQVAADELKTVIEYVLNKKATSSDSPVKSAGT